MHAVRSMRISSHRPPMNDQRRFLVAGRSADDVDPRPRERVMRALHDSDLTTVEGSLVLHRCSQREVHVPRLRNVNGDLDLWRCSAGLLTSILTGVHRITGSLTVIGTGTLHELKLDRTTINGDAYLLLSPGIRALLMTESVKVRGILRVIVPRSPPTIFIRARCCIEFAYGPGRSRSGWDRRAQADHAMDRLMSSSSASEPPGDRRTHPRVSHTRR
jgi:hypothetical protein